MRFCSLHCGSQLIAFGRLKAKNNYLELRFLVAREENELNVKKLHESFSRFFICEIKINIKYIIRVAARSIIVGGVEQGAYHCGRQWMA